MKRNAIARIIIYSIIIALLSLLLMANLRFRLFSFRNKPEHKITIIETEPDSAMVTLEESFTDTSLLTSYVFNPDEINNLVIDWAAGNIFIERQDIANIQISEELLDGGDDFMVMSRADKTKTLTIQSDKEKGFSSSLFGGTSLHKKNLTILVPLDWECRELEINTASAEISVQGLTAQEVEINCASSDSRFTDCAVRELEVNAASGNVIFGGTLKDFECDSASGSADLDLKNIPDSISMESVSGKLTLRLPSDSGFTVDNSSPAGKLDCEFPIDNQLEKKKIVCGDGHCKINMSAVSGHINILNSGSTAHDWGEHHTSSHH